jgi:hypothetical protein
MEGWRQGGDVRQEMSGMYKRVVFLSFSIPSVAI